MDESEDPAAAEARLTETPELFVFAADTEENIDRDARLADLMRRNEKLTTKEVLLREAMWTWYRLK